VALAGKRCPAFNAYFQALEIVIIVLITISTLEPFVTRWLR
jgi:hypothetical protein